MVDCERSRLAGRIADCGQRRDQFFRQLPRVLGFAIIGTIAGFLGLGEWAVAVTLLASCSTLMFLFLRLASAKCPWCERPFFFAIHAHPTVGGLLTRHTTLWEKQLQCASCGIEIATG
jgi:hypothetical protein